MDISYQLLHIIRKVSYAHSHIFPSLCTRTCYPQSHLFIRSFCFIIIIIIIITIRDKSMFPPVYVNIIDCCRRRKSLKKKFLSKSYVYCVRIKYSLKSGIRTIIQYANVHNYNFPQTLLKRKEDNSICAHFRHISYDI